METLPCNSFEVTNTKESFCFIFKFSAPDGKEKTVYVSMSPAGAKSLAEVTSEGVTDHEKQHGAIKAWERQRDKDKVANNSDNIYR